MVSQTDGLGIHVRSLFEFIIIMYRWLLEHGACKVLPGLWPALRQTSNSNTSSAPRDMLPRQFSLGILPIVRSPPKHPVVSTTSSAAWWLWSLQASTSSAYVAVPDGDILVMFGDLLGDFIIVYIVISTRGSSLKVSRRGFLYDRASTHSMLCRSSVMYICF